MGKQAVEYPKWNTICYKKNELKHAVIYNDRNRAVVAWGWSELLGIKVNVYYLDWSDGSIKGDQIAHLKCVQFILQLYFNKVQQKNGTIHILRFLISQPCIFSERVYDLSVLRELVLLLNTL